MKYRIFKDAVIFKVSGRDAARYINSRLTNDLNLLQDNKGQRSAALSPQGKVEGVFEIFKINADEFLLVADKGPADRLLDVFLRFKVADMVDVSDCSSDFVLVHICAETPQLESFKSEFFYVPNRRLGAEGIDVVIPGSSYQDVLSLCCKYSAIELSEELFESERIISGQPAFPIEINSDTLLAAIDTEELVSNSKGCYVGQEVIEKLSARGKAPYCIKRLLIEKKVSDITGQKVLDHKGAQLGVILSSA
ncbi:MAG: hypothetical protein D6719_00290, partial [Candidatus Dadabacteria bacterium]